MGQHKTNPTAILAKEGKIPPKKKGLSKREMMNQVIGFYANKVWYGNDVLKEIDRRQQEEMLED